MYFTIESKSIWGNVLVSSYTRNSIFDQKMKLILDNDNDSPPWMEPWATPCLSGLDCLMSFGSACAPTVTLESFPSNIWVPPPTSGPLNGPWFSRKCIARRQWSLITSWSSMFKLLLRNLETQYNRYVSISVTFRGKCQYHCLSSSGILDNWILQLELWSVEEKDLTHRSEQWMMSWNLCQKGQSSNVYCRVLIH